MNNTPPIYFYLPESDWRDDIPDKPDVYWLEFEKGIYCWTVQTYLYLKADGFPCELVSTIPKEGIVVAFRDSFPYALKPTAKILMVCLKPDRNRHPYAQLHVVQNPQDTQNLSNSYYIPLWRQPGLIPRDSGRGDKFENIGYFGISHNLAKELKAPSWREKLQELGLNWEIIPKESWHDYSNIDAVVAVRNFQGQDYTQKPASKLYNCWHAGVPAILGCESAFQSEYKSDLDYIEVKSLDEAISALKHLQDNPQLRQKMRENGKVRSQDIRPQEVVKKWVVFLQNVAIPEYKNWCNLSNWQQQLYVQKCYLKNIKIQGLFRKTQNLLKIK